MRRQPVTLSRMSPYDGFWGASRQWFVLITCFAAFIIGEPEPRWLLMSRLRR